MQPMRFGSWMRLARYMRHWGRLGHCQQPQPLRRLAGIRRTLEVAGFIVAVHEARLLSYRGIRFRGVGRGDPVGSFWSHGGDYETAPDVEQVLQNVSAGTFVVALVQNSTLWPELAHRSVALTLSGHTHHGQLSLTSALVPCLPVRTLCDGMLSVPRRRTLRALRYKLLGAASAAWVPGPK